MNRKLALCVGINAYPDPSARLAGCVNDALDWADLLRTHGYEVTLLLDQGATKANILTELQRMVAAAGWADRIVFTFSGHGSWIPDDDGDEVDGRDEVLCAHDYADGGLISDDELQAVAGGTRFGTGLLVLADSCHSGSVNRVMAGARDTRFLAPHRFTYLTESEAIDAERDVAVKQLRTASLISGCADAEYSYDAWFGMRANGAFTRAAIDTYQPGMSLAAWHKAIRRILPSGSYRQSPQLSATAYRKYGRAL